MMSAVRFGLSCGLAIFACAAFGQEVAFEKKVLCDEAYYCDGIATGDFDRDGAVDVVAGPFWYGGPGFGQRHEIYPPVPFDPAKAQSDSLFSDVYDFNGDGWPDVLVRGRVHLHPARWYENPQGKEQHWKRHDIFPKIQGENPPFADVTGDGRPEIVTHWEGSWGYVAPDWSRPHEPWTFHPLGAEGNWPQFHHGQGVGDLTGDGLPDILINEGWLARDKSQTAKGESGWLLHPHRFAKQGGAQMLVYDVDGDGDADVVTSLDAHGWGLAWFENVGDKGTGSLSFVEHRMMGSREEESQYGIAFSQPHALAAADIDGDGLTDVVVGKRRWAHGPKGDIEPDAPAIVAWFRLERTDDGVRFRPHVIDDHSGVGLQIVATDVNADGRLDVLTASKLGTFLFLAKPEDDATSAAVDQLPGERLVEVAAGEHPRQQTPVFLELPETLRDRAAFSLVRVDTREAVDVQRLTGEPPRLAWIVDDLLPAGRVRQYRLMPDKASSDTAPAVTCRDDGKQLRVAIGDRPVLSYNHAMVSPPPGVDACYRCSGFIHPLLSPAGRAVTDDFPPDHLHQHGVFFAWVNTTFEGRNIDFWNQVKQEGRVDHVSLVEPLSGNVFGQFSAILHHSDLTAPGGLKTVLEETRTVRVYNVGEQFLIDFESRQKCAGDSPLTINEYHYGGLAIRGNRQWFGQPESDFLTSEGKGRQGNHTRPNWVELYGKVDGHATGVLIMGDPQNFRAPQPVRLHPDKPYFCFSPMVLGPMEIAPGKEYVSRYRYCTHDGKPDPALAERLWNDYADPPQVRLRPVE